MRGSPTRATLSCLIPFALAILAGACDGAVSIAPVSSSGAEEEVVGRELDPETGELLLTLGPSAAGGETARWGYSEHRGYMEDAARFWGLQGHRVATVKLAGDDPDFIQTEDPLVIGGMELSNQQWSHAILMPKGGGPNLYGDLEQDFRENLTGGEDPLDPGGEDVLYPGKSAAWAAGAGHRQTLDWFLGAVGHYVTDARMVVHNTWFERAEAEGSPIEDFVDLGWTDTGFNLDLQWDYHHRFERWLERNAYSGHGIMTLALAGAGSGYYDWDSVGWSKEALYARIRNVAWNGSYHVSVGKNALDAWFAAGAPDTAGSGSPAAVAAAVEMAKRTVWHARGYLRWALKRFDAFADKSGGYVAGLRVHQGAGEFASFTFLPPGDYDLAALQARGCYAETLESGGGGAVYSAWSLRAPGLLVPDAGRSLGATAYFSDGSSAEVGGPFVAAGHTQSATTYFGQSPSWSRRVVRLMVR